MTRTVFLIIIAAALVAAEPAPLRIVCFGDSITGNRPGEAYLHQYLKWTDLLGLMIEGRNGLGSIVVTNAGYAGDRTQRRGDRPGAINRLETEVIEPAPDIVIMLIGGNDVGSIDRAETAENLAHLFGRSRAAGIRVLALQYAVLADQDTPGAWHHLADNNDLIAAAAAAHDIPVVDLGGPMRAAAAHAPVRSLVNMRDRVHLAPGGEMVVARAVFAALLAQGWLDH